LQHRIALALMKLLALAVEVVLLLQPVVLAEFLSSQQASTKEVVASETVRSLLRGRNEHAPETWGVHLSRALSQVLDDSGSGKRAPNRFTARVQFNGTFPGPGSATFRSMTSYWIYGEEHQERLTSMLLTRALSSGSTVFSTVYDSVTSDDQDVETKLDVWKGIPGTCSRTERAQRLVDGTMDFSICRFCPQSWRTWFPSTKLTKGQDEVVTVSVGEGGATASIDCKTYEWFGDDDAMHKVWFSKQTGLVVKEAQRQEGGRNPYAAYAEMTIAYDAMLPKELFGSAPTKEELFVLPAGCSRKA